MWNQLFGSGFVNPVDDFNVRNRPSNPEALDLLARDFAENGFDLKRLIRVIANTKTYQLSSRSSADNANDRTFFSKSVVRAMPPEHLLRSLSALTGLEITSDAMRDRYNTVREKVDDVDFGAITDQVRSYVRSNPGKALLISVGAGFLMTGFMAWLYNVIARWVGGLEITLETEVQNE